MRFKALSFVVLSSLILVQGCGLIGQKQSADSVLNYNTPNAGCLDHVGDQISQYSSGAISPADWNGAWDCVSSSLTLFGQFIRGSVPAGYTPEDIQVFMSHFLFSSTPIGLDVVQSIFTLKASVFGGTADVVTLDEVNGILNLITVLKTETGRVLPYLTTRTQNPTPENLLLLASAIQTAGTNIALAFNTKNNSTFTATQIQTLVTLLQKTLGSSTDLGPIGQLLTSVKQLFALGGSDGIEGAAWPVLIQSLSSYFGPVLAVLSYSDTYASGVNAKGQFYIANLNALLAQLNATIAANGGSIPFSAITNVIQNIPDSILNSTQRTAVSGALDLAFNHLLESKTPNAIDMNVSTYLQTQAGFWNRIQTILETIYSTNGFDTDQGVNGGQLNTALNVYLNALNPDDTQGISDVQWLLNLVQTYRPYYIANDTEIQFSPLELYSLHDMSMKHLIRTISITLMSGYSTQADKTHVSQADFIQLANDVTPILAAFQMADASIPNVAESDFLQANLFMPSSNGDGFIDVNEGSEFILNYMSLTNQSKRVLPVVSAVCKSYGTDPYGAPLMSAQCFRTNYFANYAQFWDRMPLLTNYYNNLSSADRASLQYALEVAGRRYGYSDQCVGRHDIDGFSGILHYIESLLERFDVNGDGILDTAESEAAFPVFDALLNSKTPRYLSDKNGGNEAAFTWILQHGSEPSGVWSDVEFVTWWLVIGPDEWYVRAPRLNLYNVVGALAPPPAPPSTSLCVD